MKRLFSKGRYIEEYLNELSKLVTIKLDKLSIINGETLDKIQNTNITIEGAFKLRIRFNNKQILARIIEGVNKVNKSERVYMLTSYSKYCGVLILNNINDFNIDFNFNDEHAGIIVLIDINLKNKLLLDFYEEGIEQWLEIEIYGNLWPVVEDLI